MKNMIVTVPSREHSSTLKIALHTWVRGESERNILFVAIWHRWNSSGLEAGLVLSFLKVCCFFTWQKQRIEERLLTLPCCRETGASTEGEVHTQLITNIFQPLYQRVFIVLSSTENKPWHFALSPNVLHKLTEKSETCPFASCSKPDINALAGKPGPVSGDNRRISALVQF